MKKSLKQRITFIYISTTLIVAIIVSSYVCIKTRDYTRETLKNSYQSSADLLYSKMDSKINSYFSYAYMLSQNPALISILLNPYDIYDTVISLNSHIEPTVRFILGDNSGIKNITVYTEKTQEEIPSIYFKNVNEIKKTNWFDKVSKTDGSFLISEDGELFIIYPIRNYHSHKIDSGFIKLDINIEAFSTELQANYSNLFFKFNDADGNVIYKTAEDIESNKYMLLTQNNLCGTKIQAAFYVQKSFLRIPLSEILFPVFLILIVFIVFSFLFMKFINRIMFLRLQRIVEQIDRIDANNFQIKIDSIENDEIGDLANCINNMSNKINDLFSELSIAKDKEKRAELEYLRAKIDPHFLYNIMDTISWIAIDGNTELISKIVNKLSVYYRTSLNYNEIENSVRNEIENVNAYLELQKIATSDSFDVKYDIDDSLLDCKICDFILQPLAENAITHGIKPLKERRGIITIKLYEKDGCIYLAVTDNGVGIKSDALASTHLPFKKTNYGIKNINSRIKLAFGNEYGLTLAPSRDGVGTSAEIKLPKIEF